MANNGEKSGKRLLTDDLELHIIEMAKAEKAKLEIAKKMKGENMDIQMIVKITGLSREVIEEL